MSTHAWKCSAMKPRQYQSASHSLPKAFKAMAKILKDSEGDRLEDIFDCTTSVYYLVDDGEWIVSVVVADA